MDDFRKHQKQQCLGAPLRGVHTYGCSCCRMIGNVNVFKKVSRRLARSRLKAQDRRCIDG